MIKSFVIDWRKQFWDLFQSKEINTPIRLANRSMCAKGDLDLNKYAGKVNTVH